MHFAQMSCFDAGIDLRCRQAGMPKQRLNRPQISAMRQQMCRETVAQGMRCRGVGKAERAAEDLNLFT